MQHSTWIYSPCEDWYIRYLTYDVNGQMHSKKECANWHWAKTNIPSVKRNKKEV